MCRARKWTVTVVVLCLLSLPLGIAGCEEWLMGAGAGLAGKETLDSWKVNLEQKKTELAAQYDEVLAELEAAPDPNTVAAKRAELTALQNQQVANEAAILTVTKILEVSQLKGASGEQKELWLGGLLAEAAGIAYLAWSKRKLGAKYSAHKAGQARFAETAPEAAAKLFTTIGVERTARGV